MPPKKTAMKPKPAAKRGQTVALKADRSPTSSSEFDTDSNEEKSDWTPLPKRSTQAPAKKAVVSKKAPAKKVAAKRNRSPTPSDESDESDVPPPPKRTKAAKPLAKKAPPKKGPAKKAKGQQGLSIVEIESGEELDVRTEVKSKNDTKICKVSGKFDIYARDLECFTPLYANGSIDFAALFSLAQNFQAEPDFTARAVIPDAGSAHEGVLTLNGFADPMSDEDYDITLGGLRFAPKPEPSVKAALSVDGGCGIGSSSGNLRMHRCWSQTDDDGGLLELFKGSLDVRVSYSTMYKRKGHGSGNSVEMPFWAIRAMKDASGREIGLDLHD